MHKNSSRCYYLHFYYYYYMISLLGVWRTDFFLRYMHDLTIFFNYIFQNTFPVIIMQHYTINEEYNLDNQILKSMKYF